MTTDEQLRHAFDRLKGDAIQAQLRWVTVSDVDKEKCVMDAIGVSDNLEYFGVQLGMGAFNIYPAAGTCCLVAIVEGQETDAFLISAESIEAVEIKADATITFNDGKLGGLVKVKELTDVINDMVSKFNTHTHQVTGVTPGSGSVVAPAPASGMKSLEQNKIENERVRQ